MNQALFAVYHQTTDRVLLSLLFPYVKFYADITRVWRNKLWKSRPTWILKEHHKQKKYFFNRIKKMKNKHLKLSVFLLYKSIFLPTKWKERKQKKKSTWYTSRIHMYDTVQRLYDWVRNVFQKKVLLVCKIQLSFPINIMRNFKCPSELVSTQW